MLTLSIQYILPSTPWVKSAEAATVKLNKKEITINVGETYQLKVSGTKSKVKWTSSKKSIATVSSNGLVKGKKAGSIFITAEVDNKELTCRVNVVVPTISYKKTENGIGGKTQYFVNNLPKEYKEEDIVWKSSNKNVFTVSEKGLVTNTGLGQAKLTATFGTYKLTKKIYVNATKENLEDAINQFEIEYVELDNRIVCIIANRSKINIHCRFQLEFYDSNDNLVSVSDSNYLSIFVNDEYIASFSIPEKEYKYYKLTFNTINEYIHELNVKDEVDVEVSEIYDYDYSYTEVEYPYRMYNTITHSDTIKLFDLNVNNHSKKRVMFEAYVIFYKEANIVGVEAFERYGNMDIGFSVIKNPITKRYINQKIEIPEYDSFRIIYSARAFK